MAIQQVFNPFEFTVSKGGSSWPIILIILAIFAVVGYILYKDKIEDGKTIFS